MDDRALPRRWQSAPAAAGALRTPERLTSHDGLGAFTWAQVAWCWPPRSSPPRGVGADAARQRQQGSPREARPTLYGDALGAVSEYLEGPYRILRKDGSAATRFAITSKLSDVKTVIDHHQALMRLHADPGVADAYDLYVNAAKAEAGKQMHDAWGAAAVNHRRRREPQHRVAARRLRCQARSWSSR